MRFLVTAGNTQEKIDEVRQWSSIFTGNTGMTIAKALAAVGEVDLLTSNRNHLAAPAEKGLQLSEFSTHAELRERLAGLMRMNKYDAVFMSAAVSDYRPMRVFAVLSRTPGESTGKEQWVVQDAQAAKVKSNHGQIAILGEQTEKLVDLFRGEWKFRGTLIKFKLEVGITREELIRIGQASRKSSGAEYLIANTLDMVEGADAGAYLLSDQGAEWVPRAQLASRMVQIVSASPAA